MNLNSVWLTAALGFIIYANSSSAELKAANSPPINRNASFLVRNWSTSDGLPQNWVECIHQSRDGYLWIGTRDGIVRFDGHRFDQPWTRIAGEATRSATIFAKSMAEDRRGNMWIATKEGMLRIGKETVRRFTDHDGLLQNETGCVDAGPSGNIWVGTPQGLCQLEADRFIAHPNPLSDSKSVLTVLEVNHSEVLVGGLDGLFHLNAVTGQFKLLWRAENKRSAPEWSAVYCLFQDSDRQIWFGLNHGFCVGKEGSWRYYSTGTSHEDNRVRQIFPSHDDTIWLIVGERLMHWTDNHLVPITGHPHLDDAAPYCLAGDREGNLWVGTRYRGLFQVRRTPLQTLTSRHGLPHNEVWSVTPANHGGLWISTKRGVCHFGDGRIQSLNPKFDRTPRGGGPILQDRGGNLWIAEAYAGAAFYQCDAGEFRSRDLETAVPHHEVYAIYEDRRQRLWIGTRDGLSFSERQPNAPVWLQGRYSHQWMFWRDLVYCWSRDCRFEFEPERVTCYYKNDPVRTIEPGEILPGDAGADLAKLKLSLPRGQLTHFDIRWIQESPDGTLWFATWGGGLNFLKEGRFASLTSEDGLADDRVTCLFQDPSDALWIGTSRGLSRLLHDRIFTFSQISELRELSINQIIEDDRGYLWIGSPSGIRRFNKQELNDYADGQTAALSSIHFDETDGMISRETVDPRQPSACKAPDGSLWFPTRHGVVVIDPSQVRKNTRPPQVHVEEIRATGRVHSSIVGQSSMAEDGFAHHISLDQAVTIPAGGAKYLEIFFTATSLTVPEKVRIRYRLVGYDDDWIEADAQRSASYTNLGPGDYEFRVIACNNHGVWNHRGAGVAITLNPYFHQTKTFRTSAALGTILIGIFIYWVKIRQLDKAHSLQRERALTRERDRIARNLHDEVGASLSQISNQIEIACRKTGPKMIAPVLQEIQSAVTATKQSLSEVTWLTDTNRDSLQELIEYANAYAEDFLSTANIRVWFEVKGSGTGRMLPSETRHELFLVIKEALHNVVKHAHASEVRMDWIFDSNHLELVISDNGKGFIFSDDGANSALDSGTENGSPAHPKNGLRNMRHRVESLGGSLVIQSRPGSGSVIHIWLTLNHDSSRHC